MRGDEAGAGGEADASADGRESVLLVESDPVEASRIADLLLGADPDRVWLKRAETLAEAVARLRAGPVDVVLLDLTLSDSKGRDTAAHLRNAAGFAPIVALADDPAEVAILDGVDCCEGCLVKASLDGASLVRAVAVAKLRFRMRADHELRAAERDAAEESLVRVIETHADGAVVFDAEGRIAHANAAALELVSGRVQVLENVRLSRADEPVDLVLEIEDSAVRAIGDESQGDVATPLSEMVPVRAIAHSIRWAGRPASLVWLRDRRDARRAEEMAKALEALEGALARGRTSSAVGLEVARLGAVVEEGAAAGAYDEIVEAARKIGMLGRGLAAAHDHAQRRRGSEAVALADIVRAVSDLLADEIPKRAELTLKLDPAPVVRGDRVALTQLALELTLDALVSLGDKAADKCELRLMTRERDGSAALGVDARARVETKPYKFDANAAAAKANAAPSPSPAASAIARRIVEDHAGTLRVATLAGRGTRREVRFPSSTAAAAPPAPVPPPRVLTPSSSATPPPRARPATAPPPAPALPGTDPGVRPRGRVLVIDPDPGMRRAYARTFSPDHDVAVAASAEEALDLIAKDARFGVILCDLEAGQVAGEAFHEAVGRARPELAARVVYGCDGVYTRRARDVFRRAPSERPLVVDKALPASEIRAIVRDKTLVSATYDLAAPARAGADKIPDEGAR